MSDTSTQYSTFKKPRWAPPSWVFGPVWTVLYVFIAVSFGYVGYLYLNGTVPFIVLLPFLLNLVFNFSYIFIQFRLRDFVFASVDVLLVLATLIWAMIAVYPIVHWIVYSNILYLAWVGFASVLQLRVSAMNYRDK